MRPSPTGSRPGCNSWRADGPVLRRAAAPARGRGRPAAPPHRAWRVPARARPSRRAGRARRGAAVTSRTRRSGVSSASGRSTAAPASARTRAFAVCSSPRAPGKRDEDRRQAQRGELGHGAGPGAADDQARGGVEVAELRRRRAPRTRYRPAGRRGAARASPREPREVAVRVVAALVHDLGRASSGGERRPDDAVHAMGAERAAGDVQRAEPPGSSPKPLEAARPLAGEELRPDRVAGDDDLAGRERAAPTAAKVTATRSASRPISRFASPGTTTCSWTRSGRRRAAGRHGGRDGDEPAGRDDDVGAEAAEQRVRPAEARGHPEREVGHVAPGELAAELAGRDRVVGDAGGRAPSVASMPDWLPTQASRTPPPSRARSAVARARPAAVCPPVPPPAKTTPAVPPGALVPRARPPPPGSVPGGAGTREPPLPRVALEGQLDQAVDQLRATGGRCASQSRG